jgi:hypothetical protein
MCVVKLLGYTGRSATLCIMKHMHPHNQKNHPESGNALFYILIAVSLLAALSYAVSEGNRTSIAALTQDRSQLMAAQVIEYGDVLSKAVSQMRLRGTTINTLRFAHDDLDATYGTYGTDPDNEVFHPNGGAVNYQTLPSIITANPDWIFTAENLVEEIGRTCGDSSCSELLAIATGINSTVCTTINDLLNVSNAASVPPADDDIPTATLFAGTFDYSGEVIGDGDGSVGGSNMAGQSAACVLDDTTGENVFYQVLWRQ